MIRPGQMVESVFFGNVLPTGQLVCCIFLFILDSHELYTFKVVYQLVAPPVKVEESPERNPERVF
jgi:hypothetical protein